MTEDSEREPTDDELAAEFIAAAEGKGTPPETESVEDDSPEAQLEAAVALAAENLAGWQRAQAEFQNYRKRQERDSQLMREQATTRVVKPYLSVLDDLDRALQNRPIEGEGAEWANGVELVYRKFSTLLENEGIMPMEALGEQFDPTLHEAVMQEESEEHESGTVIEVLQKGYLISDRVLRPALVKVAA